MTLRFAPNLSLLWAGLPLADRFERAAAAGFGAVELWWPGDDDARALPGLTERWGLRLALLNFDAGDMPGGDRGLAADPARVTQLRANVPLALRIAQECGCSRLNLLAGLRDERYPLAEQLRLTTTAAAAGFIREVARENVRLQYDAYHMQRMEGDLIITLNTYWELISHIQIADVPGRGEPGTGELNYRYLLDHLDAKGYDGWIGLEYRPSTGVPEDSFGWLELLGRPRGQQEESRS
jgi:hydroxypyruvate isomerase